MDIELSFLELSNGKSPYLEWERRLDASIRGAIRIRIAHLRLGKFGDCKTIKGATGLYETRIHLGAGYRIYFGKTNETLVIILCAGSKSTQDRDIEKAKEYWQLYKNSLTSRKS